MSQTKAQLLDGKSATIEYIAGSASAPAITFTGDTNTGLYSPGADQVAISTNGTGRLFVDSTGRVGLGTSNVSGKLHLAGYTSTDQLVDLQISRSSSGTAIQTGPNITFADGTTNNTTTLQVTQGRFGVWNYGSGGWYERLCVTPAGLVGVGTTSPNSVLQVNSGTNLGGILVGFNSGSSNFYDADLQVFRTGNGTERARIDSSGRLLVGTSSASSIGGTTSLIQSEITTATWAFAAVRNTADMFGPSLVLAKSRGTTSGSTTTVQNGDQLGVLYFAGANGSNLSNLGASIEASVDGTVSGGGANDMPGRLVFSTTADGASSPTERMRISNTGGVSIFANSDPVFAMRSARASGTTDTFLYGYYSATDNTNGSFSIRVYTNGNVQNTNNSYGSLSDLKLKENIVDANSQWDDIKALQVRNYNFKEGQTHTQIGLIAQEVELVSPGLVSESPDRDAEGNDLGTVTKSVNYSVLYMKAVKALQEAMERIETLEANNADLLARVSALEST